jgi:hypothetical protein
MELRMHKQEHDPLADAAEEFARRLREADTLDQAAVAVVEYTEATAPLFKQLHDRVRAGLADPAASPRWEVKCEHCGALAKLATEDLETARDTFNWILSAALDGYFSIREGVHADVGESSKLAHAFVRVLKAKGGSLELATALVETWWGDAAGHGRGRPALVPPAGNEARRWLVTSTQEVGRGDD